MATKKKSREKQIKPREYLRNVLFGKSTVDNSYAYESSRKAVSALKSLLEQSVKHGESNSAIIVGSEGVGKSWIVEQSLHYLQSRCKLAENYTVVKLNGLIHTDDRLAVLEIARQINVASNIEDNINLSFADALSHVLDIISSGSKSDSCIIFILEEFHLFTHHKNQTLLYNLFDLAQSPVCPVAVIGLTCRTDVLELLEKRVKSRFSHRIIHLLPPTEFDEYISMFQTLLTVPQHILNHKQWNKHIKELSARKDVLQVLDLLFSFSTDVASLKLLLGSAICHIYDDDGLLECETLRHCLSLNPFFNNSTTSLIHSLSSLEVSVLIASKAITELRQEEEYINFEMIFEQYTKFLSRHSHTAESMSKPVVLKAYEKLLSLNIFSRIHSNNDQMVEYQQVKLVLDPSEIVEAVKTYKHCPTHFLYWVEQKPITS